jgi:RimJ/RimL family protein N-acetyltransferase
MGRMSEHTAPVGAGPDAWRDPPRLGGQFVRLEPLTLADAPGYLAAAGDPEAEGAEVFRWHRFDPPRTEPDAAAQIRDALDAAEAGERIPLAQLDAASGEFIGTTSLYEIDPTQRALAIGHTWLGRRWWRTGANTESKLLLLTHAFDDLGAVRVVWHVDNLNERSQAAVLRLGAVHEGSLRKHRRRRDGTWRDTELFSMLDTEWPAARDRLRAALRPRAA